MLRDADLEKHLYEEQSLNIEPLCIVEINQNNHTDIEQLGVFKINQKNEYLYNKWGHFKNDESMYYDYDIVTSEMHASEKIFETIYFDKRRKRDYFPLADCFTDFRPRSGINKLVKPAKQKNTYVDNLTSANRPRYYVPSVGDAFKYWTSWNNETTKKDQWGNLVLTGYTGVSGPLVGGVAPIESAAPFVIYTKYLPVNMVTVKIQTGLGQPSPLILAGKTASPNRVDELASTAYSTLPSKWRIEYLDRFGTWTLIKAFSSYDPRNPGFDPITGNLDLVYMVINPSQNMYPNFVLRHYVESFEDLPINARHGDAYVVGRSHVKRGDLYVFNSTLGWIKYKLQYGWEIYDQTKLESAAIKRLVDPPYYNSTITDAKPLGDRTQDEYDDFVIIKGLRIVVNSMVVAYKPFELIELSPRLLCNITSYMTDYSVEKTLGQETQLLAGEFAVHNGTVTLSNAELLLNREKEFKPMDDTKRYSWGDEILDGDPPQPIPRDRHTGSLLASRIRRNTRFRIYEIVRDVKEILNPGSTKKPLIYDKIIPIKTLYSLDHPIVFDGNRDLEIELRDASMIFENTYCPNILLYECSLSKAVAVLLDWVGFSNYIFKDNAGENEADRYGAPETPLSHQYVDKAIIPYFFTSKDQTVLEALSDLSKATQCPMYFDENNNFVVAPPDYFAASDGPVYIFYGTKSGDIRPNIESIDDISTVNVSDIEVTFTSRGPEQNASYSLMKEMGIASFPDFDDKAGGQVAAQNLNLNLRNTKKIKWGYVPVSVWNGADSDDLEHNILTAAVLNNRLSKTEPYLSVGSNGLDIMNNNTIDVGIYAEYFEDYQGFLLMNGEIIEYDAIRYNIGGKELWIQSRTQLNEEVNKQTHIKHALPYAYATGLLRIYTEVTSFKRGTPEEPGRFANRKIVNTGRGRFGTPITEHSVTVNSPWNYSSKATMFVDSGTKTLFGDVDAKSSQNWKYARRPLTIKTTNIATTEYIINSLYTNSSIQNKFPRALSSYNADQLGRMVKSGQIMKASAITMSGPTNATPNHMYVKTKVLDHIFDSSPANTTTLFGTRLGIIGNSSTHKPDGQNAIATYVDGDNVNKSIYYASGGLSLLTSNKVPINDQKSNDGYYYELGVLDAEHKGPNGELYANLRFYKINNGTPIPAGLPKDNICIPLWSGWVKVTPTQGANTNRVRYITSQNFVHDLSVEWNYAKKNNVWTNTFILYYNNSKIATVSDSTKSVGYLPRLYNKVEFGLFVRGKSSVQFEHVYAVKTGKKMPPSNILGDSFHYEWEKPTDFMMFSPSALWTQAMIDGGSKTGGIYYDEFGTIARQVKHINAQFNLHPVMGAQIQVQPVFDKMHFVSSFTYDPFQASFLLWNMADATIEVQGQQPATALSILGVPFKDAPQETLTLRSFFIDRNAGDKPDDARALSMWGAYYDYIASDKLRATVKAQLSSLYIQNRDQIRRLFSWLQYFTGDEFVRMSITAFGTPHVQLGDMVAINYSMPDMVQEHAKRKNEPLTPADPEYDIDYVDLREQEQGFFMVKKITVERGEEGPVYKYDLVELPYINDIFYDPVYPGGY